MRCFDRRRRGGSGRLGGTLLARALLAFALALGCLPAAAHKASDAYLHLKAAEPGRIELRWDIALRDLDLVLDLDADADGRLTWGEIKTAWSAIEGYALPRLAIDGCPLRAGGRGLERRADGAYAVLILHGDCSLPVAPRMRYALLREADPTHRGIVRIERADGSVAVQLLAPDDAHASIGDGADGAAAPARAAAPHAGSFLLSGVEHIATGYDHLLFLLCLVVPAVVRREGRGWRPVARPRDALLPVLVIVTGFTVAHSITLSLAALKLVALPASLIEPAIAATIVLTAADNLRPIFAGVHRGFVAFAFGLIHGFGFANVLGELDLPRRQFAWALLQFNAGIELGQVAIVGAAVLALFAVRGWRAYPRVAIGGASVLAIALGVAWFIERTAAVALLPM